MEFVLIALGLAVLTGMIGNNKGKGFGMPFFMGLLFGVFALIYYAVCRAEVAK